MFFLYEGKHGAAGLTKALCNEWAKYNINVKCHCPDIWKTDNTAALIKDKTRYQEILKRIPAGRWGTNADLKGTVVFLASKPDYLNGAIIPADGGYCQIITIQNDIYNDGYIVKTYLLAFLS